MLYCTTLLTLGLQRYASNNTQQAFDLISNAITNYQSVQTEDTNRLTKEGVLTMYSLGANLARMLGKTNEGDSFLRTLKSIQTGSTAQP